MLTISPLAQLKLHMSRLVVVFATPKAYVLSLKVMKCTKDSAMFRAEQEQRRAVVHKVLSHKTLTVSKFYPLSHGSDN